MNVENLLNEAKIKFNHNLSKHYLKEKYLGQLIFADQGGLWKADLQLISFLAVVKTKNIIIIDEYEKPVLVDRDKLLDNALKKYNDIMTKYHQEYLEQMNQR